MKSTFNFLALAIVLTIGFFSCSKVSDSKIKGMWNVTYYKAEVHTTDSADPSYDYHFIQEMSGNYYIITLYEDGSLTFTDTMIVNSYTYDFKNNDQLMVSASFTPLYGGAPIIQNQPGVWQSMEDNKLALSFQGQQGITYDINSISKNNMDLSGSGVAYSGTMQSTQTYELQLGK